MLPAVFPVAAPGNGYKGAQAQSIHKIDLKSI